ncbi:hypothetical protein [uncultured Sphingomonas sp.]|uniref:hypothetical protein n=1 Tax=uncultured Sphingomonas sp. TaxID=158754 RepID=UPI0035CBDEDE
MAPTDFDLAKVPPRPAAKCGSSGDDIVVCARKDAAMRYRYQRLPDDDEGSAVPRAETAIGNVKASVEVERKDLPGAASNRVMVKLKLPS